VLVRGRRAYVANGTKGTITVIDIEANWKVVDEVEVGEADLFYLSAPDGAAFDGRALATCWNVKGGTTNHFVDLARDQHRKLFDHNAQTVIATADPAGERVVEQLLCEQPRVAVRDWTRYLRGEPEYIWNNQEVPYVSGPCGPDGFWVGGNGLFDVREAKAVAEWLGVLAVPDPGSGLVYVLKRGEIDAIRPNGSRPLVGRRAAIVPAWLTTYAEDVSEQRRRDRAPVYLDRWRGITGRNANGTSPRKTLQ
jgi:hypothetical protein